MRWLILLLLCSLASAQTLVQKGGNNSAIAGTTLAQSAAFGTVTTGDLVVVIVGTGTNTTTHSAPTDTASNTYTQVTTGSPQSASVWGKLSMWFKCNATGGSSFSVTANTGSDTERSLIVLDYSGVASASCLDISGGALATATGTPTVTIAPTSSGDVIVGGIQFASTTAAYTAASGYTAERQEPSNGDFSTHAPIFAEDKLSAASGSQAVAGGGSVTSGWGIIAAAFKAAATASGSMLGGPGMVGGPSQVQ
jgi:hypothetical protein